MKKQSWWLRAIQRFPARTGGNVKTVTSVDVDSNITLVIDPHGVVSQYAYDGLKGCCQDTVDAGTGANAITNAPYLNAETVTSFDADGNIRRVTEAGDTVAQFVCDDLDAE
jgi:hypothetical protein